MNNTVSSSLTTLVDAYCNVWCETDPDKRRKQLTSIFATNGTYLDQTIHITGCDALLTHISKIHTLYPGSKIVRTSNIQEHHNCVRFAWRLIQADGTKLPEGIDFVDITNDAKIQRVVGFFGPLDHTALL